MILTDFAKAVGQLPDPKFRRILLLGIGLTLGLLAALYVILVFGLIALLPSLDFVLNEQQIAGAVPWVGLGSFILIVLLSFSLMVPVASLITSFFLDDVAAAVEEKHYPLLPRVSKVAFWQGVTDTVNFFGIMVLFNVVAFIAALMLPFFGPFIFFGTNGYLLGREYFQLVATRRVGRDGAAEMFKTYRGRIWFAGCLMTLPLFLPLVNILIPILGAATFTHFFHRVWAEQSLG